MFSIPRDAELARMAVSSVPRDVFVSVVVDGKDRAFFEKSGIPFDELVTDDFDRKGNLNGKEACLAIAGHLARVARGRERVLKMDSDVLMIDGGFPSEGGLSGIRHKTFLMAAYGGLYGMSSETAIRLQDRLLEVDATGFSMTGEDVVITGAALSLGERMNTLPIQRMYWERYDGRCADRGHAIGHYKSAVDAGRRMGGRGFDLNSMSINAMDRDFRLLSLNRRS